MKKINSIGYGGKILSFAMIFLLLIPVVSKLIIFVCKNRVLDIYANVSFRFGIIIILFLIVLLAIEFYQDKKQILSYEAQINEKISLGKGAYECQFCGNRLVKPEHKSCCICGRLFKERLNSMIKLDEMSALAKTLLIPLAVRAKETQCEHPLIADTMAVDILNQIDTSNLVIDGGGISTHGILARTKVIDHEVKALIDEHPHAIVINLGAGLDTRFFRLDNGDIQWYDLDLPEVISLRKQFIPENERVHLIAKSIMDASWINNIRYTPNDTIILISEGLMMYFIEAEVKEVFNTLVEKFSQADMFLDVVHSFFIGKKISSEFLWGIAKAEEMESLNKNISVKRAWSAGKLLKQRQSFVFRLLNIFPSTKNRSQIIHLKLKG